MRRRHQPRALDHRLALVDQHLHLGAVQRLHARVEELLTPRVDIALSSTGELAETCGMTLKLRAESSELTVEIDAAHTVSKDQHRFQYLPDDGRGNRIVVRGLVGYQVPEAP